MDDNFVVQKNAVLLNKRGIQAREWRNYIIENWDRLTENLKDAVILIITGRHGKSDGSIGHYDENVVQTHLGQVGLQN